MGFSDYFGRFWFAAEPIFGVVMTLVFLGILRNQALYAFPELLDRIVLAVISAAISCCIAWGIVDGIFYAWENHALAARKNLIAKYAIDQRQKDASLKMVEADLEDSYVDLLDEDEKKNIYESVISKLSQSEKKQRVPIKNDLITIFLDFGLNLGACLVIVFPLLLLRNVLAVSELVTLAVIIAIFLMFIIGFWTETRKELFFKAKKGTMYAALGVIITVLTYILGG